MRWELCGSLGTSQPAGAGACELQLLPLLVPGPSCSKKALAARARISVCSEVKVKVPKVEDEVLTTWPTGSMEAMENPRLPPQALEPRGCPSASWSSTHACCSEGSFLGRVCPPMSASLRSLSMLNLVVLVSIRVESGAVVERTGPCWRDGGLVHSDMWERGADTEGEAETKVEGAGVGGRETDRESWRSAGRLDSGVTKTTCGEAVIL